MELPGDEVVEEAATARIYPHRVRAPKLGVKDGSRAGAHEEEEEDDDKAGGPAEAKAKADAEAAAPADQPLRLPTRIGGTLVQFKQTPRSLSS